MKIQRRTKQEEGAVTDIRRIRPLRMDGLTMKEKYQDMKIDIPKKRFPLRRKLYNQQRVHQSLWRTKKRRQYDKLLP
jgi:hypothetical protein